MFWRFLWAKGIFSDQLIRCLCLCMHFFCLSYLSYISNNIHLVESLSSILYKIFLFLRTIFHVAMLSNFLTCFNWTSSYSCKVEFRSSFIISFVVCEIHLISYKGFFTLSRSLAEACRMKNLPILQNRIGRPST